MLKLFAKQMGINAVKTRYKNKNRIHISCQIKTFLRKKTSALSLTPTFPSSSFTINTTGIE